MSDKRQPIEILLDNMRRRLVLGGMTYAEAVMLDDIITTIDNSIPKAAEDRETGIPDDGRDADRRLDGGQDRA